jgi:hypothetical protein
MLLSIENQNASDFQTDDLITYDYMKRKSTQKNANNKILNLFKKKLSE